MPQLSELANNRKFVKKEYRPWDLSGSGTVDNKDNTTDLVNSSSDPLVSSSALVESNKNQTTASPEVLSPVKKETILVNIDKTEEATNLTKTTSGNNTDNEKDNKQRTNKERQDNIRITAEKQPENNQRTIKQPPNHELNNVTDNNDEITCLTYAIKKLSGIQKDIFQFVIDVCSARGAMDTGILLSSELAHAANCSTGSAKTSLIRLIEKNLIIRLEGKASRGGHMILGVTKNIQVASYQAQQALYNPLRKKISDNFTDNNSNNSFVLNSSNKIINTTTNLLSEDWKKINFEPLTHIGFSETQLFQLHSSNMSAPEIVQDAIYKFAYSLKNNEKVQNYNDPLNVLMGILRKGQRWNEPNYISEKELALKQLIEEKRKQKETQDAMINELFELEFPDWKKTLTADEIANIVPAETRNSNFSGAIQSYLRTHFIEQILKPRIGF